MDPKAKIVFILLVVIGYIVGVMASYPKLNQQFVNKQYCAESIGPISCQPDEDCDRECVRYEYKSEPRGREAFYTYGLLGAFIGGWVGVFVVTYLPKK